MKGENVCVFYFSAHVNKYVVAAIHCNYLVEKSFHSPEVVKTTETQNIASYQWRMQGFGKGEGPRRGKNASEKFDQSW